MSPCLEIFIRFLFYSSVFFIGLTMTIEECFFVCLFSLFLSFFFFLALNFFLQLSISTFAFPRSSHAFAFFGISKVDLYFALLRFISEKVAFVFWFSFSWIAFAFFGYLHCSDRHPPNILIPHPSRLFHFPILGASFSRHTFIYKSKTYKIATLVGLRLAFINSRTMLLL